MMLFVVSAIFFSCSNESGQDSMESVDSEYQLDRTILPIQPPSSGPITEMDARNVDKPEHFEVKAPEGSPNVVVVLIDDIGFGATTAFGGAINTPTFDRLADNGLRFTDSIPLHCAHRPGPLYCRVGIITSSM